MSNSNKTISGPNYTPPKIKHTTLVYTNFNFFQKKFQENVLRLMIYISFDLSGIIFISK